MFASSILMHGLVLNTWERLSKRLFIIFFGLIREDQLVLPAWGT